MVGLQGVDTFGSPRGFSWVSDIFSDALLICAVGEGVQEVLLPQEFYQQFSDLCTRNHQPVHIVLRHGASVSGGDIRLDVGYF